MTTVIPQTPEKTTVFEYSSVFNTTLDRMQAFHAAPNAFSVLTPPPIIAQIHRRDLTSLTDGTIEFTLWFGPIPVRWLAQHEPAVNEYSFADRMIEGPMAYWLHQHIIEEVNHGVRLTDRIQLIHKPGLRGFLTRLTFDGLPLKMLFMYRHLRTRIAVEKR